VVANTVEPILVPAVGGGGRVGFSAKLFVENAKTQPLACLDFGIIPCLPQDQVAAFGPDVFRVRQLCALP
jgi:hypothetical protein